MRRIVAYKGYFRQFYDSLDTREKDKVDRVFLLMQSEAKMPMHYIRFIEDAIFELRISVPNKELRFFFTYDGDQIIILFNCFVKKTQKTPRSEIEKALKLKREYYEAKDKH